MEKKDIILIVLDTLRKDKSSEIEKLVEEYGFISYNNVIAPSSWTIPSHASMFTGLYAAYHGAHETKVRKPPDVRLKKREDFLASVLRRRGYASFLLSANPQVGPRTGFSDFDYIKEVRKPIFTVLSVKGREYLIHMRWSKNINSTKDSLKFLLKNKKYYLFLMFAVDYIFYRINSLLLYIFRRWPKEKGSKKIKRELQTILKKNKKNPSFIFVNLIEVHEPYLVFEKLSFIDNFRKNGPDPKYVEKWIKLYEKETRYLCKRVANILKMLEKEGELANSLIIITSDHGQLLGEDGKIGHGTFLHDELLSVPLFIKYPDSIKISKKSSKKSWISINSLYTLLLKFSEGDLTSDSCLFSKTVFAESYGVVRQTSKFSSEIFNKKIEALERYKIAVYGSGFKGVFDVGDWKFDYIVSYNNSRITEEVRRMLKRDVLHFLEKSVKMRFLKIL